MNYILFDDEIRLNLLPLTFTRPVADLRLGIITMKEKWQFLLKGNYSYYTVPYLREKFPLKSTNDNIFINASVLPTAELIDELKKLPMNTKMMKEERMIAMRTGPVGTAFTISNITAEPIQTSTEIVGIKNCWDIFSTNDQAINFDFPLLTTGRKSAEISKTNTVIHPENIFIEEGAVVECAILNASAGPIYIGKNAEIMEGAMIRGPFSLGEGATVKMGAKIYGATSIGPFCKVGGEVSNSVLLGYSNKGHDGFLGNSVLGEWCNLGADTNNSNLKNNYSKVKLWSYAVEDYVNTGLQFCGLIMGDHSKCSINTMFNTGTVVGVSANIFGTGFPPKFIPSFSWGGCDGFTTYRLEEANEVATRVYERREMIFDEEEKKIMKHLFEVTTKYRSW